MITENGNNLVMPVSPMYGGGGYGGNGGFGNDWGSWIILFLIFGMFGRGGWGGNDGGSTSSNSSFPWLLNANDRTEDSVQAGFNQAATTGQLTAIQNSLASAEVANCQRTIESIKTDYQNQIASMNQRFADVTNTNTQMNNLAAGLQNCCCENRSSIADLKSELLSVYAAGIQSIKDEICADRIAAKEDRIADLTRQLQTAQFQASQTAQTAAIRAGQVAEIDAMYNRLRDCPVPTMPVYGSQPIFTCPGNNYNNGCGCGM